MKRDRKPQKTAKKSRKNIAAVLVYSGAAFALPVFRTDPNRDPNAEKSGGIIRVRKDTAVKFSERKGAKML